MTTTSLPEGRIHGDDCSCTRCAGFQRGNGHALTHGCYSPLRLQPRAREIREGIAPLVPFAAESDAPLLDLASTTLAQVERAALVLAWEQARAAQEGEPPSERLDRLSKDTRLWIAAAGRLLDQLGLSPTSRARLAGDLAIVQRAATAQSLRERYTRSEHGDERD